MTVLPVSRPGEAGRFRVTHDQLVPSIALHDAGSGADVTSDIVLTVGVNTVPVDATSGAVTVTLPPLVDAYQEVMVSKRDSSANLVTVDANGSETINGATTQVISVQYTTLRLRPGPTEWMVA